VGDVPLRLDVFEGPLDILLHLVREQKLDINDIPIAKITEQYLAYLDVMQALNLEVAGEFLVMASTLVHIKSKSLLPRHGDEEEEEDPEAMRRELSRRLIEYERFKEAAARLGDRPVLGRDVFVRDFLGEEIPEGELVIAELSMADLITAFKDALARMPADTAQEFFVERTTPYFDDYVKRYTDLPFLVKVEDGRPGKFLTAEDLPEQAAEENTQTDTTETTP